MNSSISNGPQIDSGMCRLCNFSMKCRVLNAQYDYKGSREVYSEIIEECFGIVYTVAMDGDISNRLICAVCVTRLREARNFRNQLLQNERKLLVRLNMPTNNFDTFTAQESVKVEPVHGRDDYNDDGFQNIEFLNEEVLDEDNPDEEDEKSKSLLEKILTSDVQNTDSDNDIDIDNARDTRLAVLRRFKRNVVKAGLVDLIPKKLDGACEGVTKKVSAKKIRKVTKKATTNWLEKRKRRVNKRKENNRVLVENSYVVPFTHSTATYHCFYCTNSFINVDELRKHTYEHSTKDFIHRWKVCRILLIDITRIDCRLCDASITDIDSFKQHITSVHNKVLYTDVKGEFIPFKLDSLDCLQCGENFYFFDKLMKHMPLHFGLHVCDVCGDRFVQASTLDSHIRCHFRKEVIYNCSICNKQFNNKRTKYHHEQVVHYKTPVLKCFKCPEKFLSHNERLRHMSALHGDKEPKFPCNVCGKLYARSTLNSHMLKVHKKNNLVCHYCGARSENKAGLKKHLREVHVISE